MATIHDVMAVIEDLSSVDKRQLARFIHSSDMGVVTICIMMDKKSPDEIADVAEMMLPSILSTASWDNHLRNAQRAEEREKIKKAVGEEGVSDGKE